MSFVITLYGYERVQYHIKVIAYYSRYLYSLILTHTMTINSNAVPLEL